MKVDITALFVCVDDFCKLYYKALEHKSLPKRKGGKRSGYLSLSEMLFIQILFHFSAYKDFKDLAQRGKSSMGWFFGFKVHLIINEKNQIMGVKISPVNTDDGQALKTRVKGLVGKCYADKGYISKELFKQLWIEGLQLITRIRTNMKNYLRTIWDKVMLPKPFLIETVFGQLKTQMSLQQSRHRSIRNAFVHILSTLLVYSYSYNKPAITRFYRIS